MCARQCPHHSPGPAILAHVVQAQAVCREGLVHDKAHLGPISVDVVSEQVHISEAGLLVGQTAGGGAGVPVQPQLADHTIGLNHLGALRTLTVQDRVAAGRLDLNLELIYIGSVATISDAAHIGLAVDGGRAALGINFNLKAGLHRQARKHW